MWQGQGRAPRLPPEWRRIRQRVLARDGYRCRHVDNNGRRCWARATQVDHVNPMTDDHADESLQSLCVAHHRRKSAYEGTNAARTVNERLNKLRFRPTDGHPGIVD